MKYIGIALILLTALLIDGAFAKHQRLALVECEGFLLLIKHVRSEVSMRLSPVSEWAESFENKRLSEIGFTSILRESNDPYKAFLLCERSLCLSKSQKELIRGFFGQFGKGSMQDEVRLADYYVKGLTEELEYSKRESARQGRVAKAALYGLSLSLAIISI